MKGILVYIIIFVFSVFLVQCVAKTLADKMHEKSVATHVETLDKY